MATPEVLSLNPGPRCGQCPVRALGNCAAGTLLNVVAREHIPVIATEAEYDVINKGMQECAGIKPAEPLLPELLNLITKSDRPTFQLQSDQFPPVSRLTATLGKSTPKRKQTITAKRVLAISRISARHRDIISKRI